MEQLLDILRIESGWDALLVVADMAIVYYVLYRILQLIKGTRAVQMLIGLVLVLFFYFLSQDGYLNLATTHWFIERFIANFIIIIVIIFQRDIRRALAEVGRTSLLSGTRAFEETQVIEEVIKASIMLSSREIGALMVIEREADLSRYTEEGIPIGATVSKDVLFNLFLPEYQNPLHDGAVIIRRGRVAAAGCFLPLTNNPATEQSFGTRHRAAIGTSEETDAAVVVVSEETGTISIAFDGELYRHLDATEMRELLQKLYSGQTFTVGRTSFLDRFEDRREVERAARSGEIELDAFAQKASTRPDAGPDAADGGNRAEKRAQGGSEADEEQTPPDDEEPSEETGEGDSER